MGGEDDGTSADGALVRLDQPVAVDLEHGHSVLTVTPREARRRDPEAVTTRMEHPLIGQPHRSRHWKRETDVS